MGNLRRVMLLIAVAGLFVGTLASGASAEPAEKVWVCHATGSATNPTVGIHVAQPAWDNGHMPPGHMKEDRMGADVEKGPFVRTMAEDCRTSAGGGG